MDNKKFGNILKKLRKSKAKKLGLPKLTQKSVAKELDVSIGSYAGWETGRTKPDVTHLSLLADYFECSIDELLGYTPSGQARVEFTSKKGLRWSLSRLVRTEKERKKVEIWERLTEGENIETISDALGTPSDKIMRYVQDVIYTDVINIDIEDFLQNTKELGEKVKKTFTLRDVVVVPMDDESSFFYRSILLGEAARTYFKTHVRPGRKVGISGGYSVSRMIYSLKRSECRFIEVYPLATNPVYEAIHLDANTLVGALVYQHAGYNVRGYALQYINLSNLEETSSSHQLAFTNRTLNKAKTVDIAFMGLGILGRRRGQVDWLSDLEEVVNIDKLREMGAIGDILFHPVTRDGEPVSSKRISNLICSIKLHDLQEMITQMGTRVVAIASGSRKAEITRAAIKGGYTNALIIDEELAEALLKSEQSVKDGE